ncbi:nickel/cobalt ABC transporter permease [Brenneria tiliae]|uniref:nickel/cobalt ABC transporter permease n=1 Tax=Brenneria tiliae TaxID=2914984 RepID=UPI002014BB28|nr:nickel/cobalt ABC transporter permease [Brenneria tiliae]MCL2897977.1 nickel ABC transporter permease subunit NikB [Brenneria tiliae]MCL2902058.1 nickel ABC transporter permease subunit NikB [Brenneria tiliae]
MKRYLCRRLLLTLPILLGISFLSFLLLNLVPADPAEVALRVNEIIPTPESIAQMRLQLGLDRPFLLRYLNWLYDAVRLDFGYSYVNNRLVLDEIARCLPATLALAALALAIILCVSVPLGVLSAVFKDSVFDRLVRTLVFLGTAMPSYWLGLLLIWWFALSWDLLPTSGSGTFSHIILPAVTLSMVYVAIYIRLIRNNMLENMQQYYVYYARARGLTEKSIILRHVLKNSLHSSITALGMSIPQLLAGTVIIENIFAWPGVGRLCISAIFNRDYPVIQAYILMMGVLFVICNLLVDIIQRWMDPALRQEG